MSCSKEFDLTDYFDASKSFGVIDQERPKNGKLDFEIKVNDPRHAKLVSWLALNNQNWKPATHNTHAGLVIIYQENFRLLLYRNKDFAVVIVTDDEGISNYYIKNFDVSRLEFLDE